MVDLVDTDGTTVIIENDDDARSTNSYASFIEWTCPATCVKSSYAQLSCAHAKPSPLANSTPCHSKNATLFL